MSNCKFLVEMKKIIIFIFAAIMTFSAVPVKAQTVKLTEEEKAAFGERIKIMLDGFLLDLSTIASKSPQYTREIKQRIIKNNLKNFLGEGEYFTVGEDKKIEYYRDAKGKIQIAPYMQVTSVRSSKPNNIPIRRYLNNLMQLPYNKVTIENADTYYMSDLYPVGDDRYEATFTYFQYFRGEYGDGCRYEDVTVKTVQVIVIMKVVEGDRMYVVRFGNILANETYSVN